MGIDKAPIYLVSKLWSTTSCPLLLIHEWCAIRNRMLIVLTRLIAKNTRVAYWSLLSLPSNISFHQLVRIIIEIKKLIMKRKRTISWIPIHEWIIRWHFSLSHFHENIYIYIFNSHQTYHLNPSNRNRLKSSFDPIQRSIRFIIYPTESEFKKCNFNLNFRRIGCDTLERPSTAQPTRVTTNCLV